MTRRALGIGIALIALVAAGLGWRWAHAPVSLAASTSSTATSPKQHATRAPGAETRLRPPTKVSPSGEVAMRRDAATRPAFKPAEGAQAGELGVANSSDTGHKAPSRTITQAEAAPLIQQTVKDDVAPAIQSCLSDWSDQLPGANGKVVVRFELGPDGLVDAGLQDYTDLPFGALSCVSAAVWEADWPAISDGSLTVRYPFQLSITPSAP